MGIAGIAPKTLFVGVLALALVRARPAYAYRPFDGTDAAVAERGDFELELGPVNYYSLQGVHSLIAPATVLNLGYAPGWELVIDFQNFVGLDTPPGQPRDRLLDTDILTKGVIVNGSLQNKGPWPSVAVESGPLLPNINAEHGFGASLDVIVSQKLPGLTVHLNNWAQLSRGNLHFDWFEGAIIEGDTEATVRPVSEWFVEHEFVANTTTLSGLVGAIWSARDNLDLDFGLREASTDGLRTTEVRLGLTWTIGVWEPEEKAGHGQAGHRLIAWQH